MLTLGFDADELDAEELDAEELDVEELDADELALAGADVLAEPDAPALGLVGAVDVAVELGQLVLVGVGVA